jgi:hypothetical protein
MVIEACFFGLGSDRDTYFSAILLFGLLAI